MEIRHPQWHSRYITEGRVGGRPSGRTLNRNNNFSGSSNLLGLLENHLYFTLVVLEQIFVRRLEPHY